MILKKRGERLAPFFIADGFCRFLLLRQHVYFKFFKNLISIK